MQWYYGVGGQQQGPVSKEELEALVAQGRLGPGTLIWRQGMSEWLPLSQVDEIAKPAGGLPPTLPPPAGGATPYSPPGASVGFTGPVERRRPWQLTLLAVVWILAALGLLAIGAALALSSQGDDGLQVFGGVVAAVGLLTGVSAVGLLRLRPWGRVSAYFASAILGLMSFPLGIIAAILIIVYLASPGMAALFSPVPVERLGDFEKQKLAALPSSALGTIVAVLLLIGPVFFGMFAAIAIPNFLNAVQRGKQKRTMGDIRVVATAVESYSIDFNAYPDVIGTAGELSEYLQPTYVTKLPTTDGWNTAIVYEVHEDGQGYWIESYGKDGVNSGPDEGPTTDFRHDIVFDSGSFLAYPDGTQR